MKTTTTAFTNIYVTEKESFLTGGNSPNSGRFIDAITLSAGAGNDPWVVHIESYPGEVYLRARRGNHTLILHKLAQREERLARFSARGLRLVALACLMAEGFKVEETACLL